MGCSPKTRILTYHVSSRLLITVVVIAQFLLSVVYASPINFDSGGDGHRHGHGHGHGNAQVAKLYNLCTEKYVRVRPSSAPTANGRRPRSTVDALGHKRDTAAILRLVPIATDRMTIQSNETEEYICFNKRGKLITKKSARGKLCQFKEKYGDNFTEFESVKDPEWFLGFRKNGKPLKGSDWLNRNSKCKRFLRKKLNKEGSEKDNQHPQHHGYQPDFKFSNPLET